MIVISWNGLKWGITDIAYFTSCKGFQYCNKYFILDTLGL